MRSPWGKFFRHDIIRNKKILFDSTFTLGEDTLFVLEYIYYVNTVKILCSSAYMHFVNASVGKYFLKLGVSIVYLKHFLLLYKKIGLIIEYYFIRSIT